MRIKKKVLCILVCVFLVMTLGGLGYAGINDGLIAHFEFENNINDSSPQQIQGVEYGNLTYESGVVGNYAARFDGEAAIYFPDSYLLNLCEGTISLFSNLDCKAPYSQSILTHYRINYMTAMIYYPETSRLGTYLSVPCQPHKWVMITYVYSNGCSSLGNRKVYLNGELYDTGTGYSNNGYLPPDYDYLSTIGQASSLPLDDPQYKYRGLIDDLRIYNRPLTDQEIQDLYQLATYPPYVPPCPWQPAYEQLFRSQSDLALMRQYRDEFLNKTAPGKLYTELLYKSSEEALEVLLNNPRLMAKARRLIEANKDGVAEVVNGNRGVIYSTDEIVSFLDAFARKSPAALKLLAIAVKREMLEKQEQGEPFLGFELH